MGAVVILLAINAAGNTTKDNSSTSNQVQNPTLVPTQLQELVEGYDQETTKASSLVQPTTIQPTMTTKPKTYSGAPTMTINAQKEYVATMNTSKGVMKIGLFAKEAPVAVNNFVFLAREGFYDNTPFHRVIKGFMIQGGDPTGTGMGSPGYKFADEKVTRDYLRGTLAMANSGPNTNGSQFFIMHADYPLPKNYVIFGKILDNDEAGFKTLDAIASTQVTMSNSGEQSSPTETISVTKVTIEER